MPAWLALTVQVPNPTKVRVALFSVQTVEVVEAKDTGKPEVAVATSEIGVAAKAWLPGEAKLIVWLAGAGASSVPPQALNTTNASAAHARRRICLLGRFMTCAPIEHSLMSPMSTIGTCDLAAPLRTPEPSMKPLSREYGGCWRVWQAPCESGLP